MSGTATVLAGRLFGVPISGTMAHSFIQAHDDEALAFEHFALAQPDNVVFLIDTYDTEAAAKKVVKLAPRLKERGIAIKAVRLDSGDLADHARKVRAILDAGGLAEVGIFASGNLDEYILARYTATGAPIDGYGIGTRLDTSSDAPYLDCAYKLQEYASRPRRKRSEGKATYPGRKQVYRYFDGEGRMVEDSLTLESDRQPGLPLLQPVMRGGRRVASLPSLTQSRQFAISELERLPARLRELAPASPPYPVRVSGALEGLTKTMA
jgi:nicotinate phosphoribosyltransferase